MLFNSPITLHGHSQPSPLAMEYIAAAVTQIGFECEFVVASALRVKSHESQRSLMLFSALSSDYPRVCDMARAAKKQGAATVLGGYHASGCRGEIDSGVFDYVVVGEGEYVAPGLATAVLQDDHRCLNQIRTEQIGTSRIIYADQISDVDSIASPLRSEERLAHYYIGDLMWPPPSQQHNTALLLASRGCTYRCDFCASSNVWGRGIRHRSPLNVVNELKDVTSNFGSNTCVFIDQSLGQSSTWALNLCNAVRDAKSGVNWYHQSNLTVERQVLQAMADAGCTKVGFGLEGISPRAIERIKPVNPHDLGKVNNIFDYCNSLGMFVKAYLMIGFPWETEEIVEEYYEAIQKLRANQIKISYLTPFPGTRDWSRYRNQLNSTEWADFDTVQRPVVHNPNISVEQYHLIRKKLFQVFYGSGVYAETTQQMLHSFPHYEQSFAEFIPYLQAYEMISGQEPWVKHVQQKATIYQTAHPIGVE